MLAAGEAALFSVTARPLMCRGDAIVFDVGGTLLNVLRDPQEMAVEAIAHLGTLSLAAYGGAIRQAVKEWRAAGGKPEKEDLPETWVAAQILEDTFLADGWKSTPIFRRHSRSLSLGNNDSAWPPIGLLR